MHNDEADARGSRRPAALVMDALVQALRLSKGSRPFK